MHSQMTVGSKLTLIGILLIGFTIALGVVTLVGLHSYQNVVDSLADDALAGVSACSKVEGDYLEMRGDMWRHLASSDPADREKMEQEIQRLKDEAAQTEEAVREAISDDEDRQINARIDPAVAAFYQAWDGIVGISRRGENKEAYKKFTAEGTPAFNTLKSALHEETGFNRRNGVKYAAEAATTGARVRWLTWLVLLISIGVGSGALFIVVRGLNRALRQAVSELTESAGQVASASARVASGSQALAQGSSQQAASLEETSASSEEITSMTQKNAENSSSAAALMSEVDRRVSEGNHTLEQMVQSMHEITGSSDKISKIIKVIDEIAFQTNILALNAAVEAARAGEAGMGFAVVADEVRSLAQRSAQAAKDTAALIEESIAKSSEGSSRLQRVSDVIRAITESTAKVKTLVDEVNLGSQEQAHGIQQISKAIVQMEQVTQSTAATAEEGASSSEELSAQAEAMGHAVRKLARLVDDGRDIDIGRTAPAKRTAASGKPPIAPRSLSLRALQSAVSKPLASKSGSPKPAAVAETPQDAEFLASFEQM